MARYDDPFFHTDPLERRWPAGLVDVDPPTPGAAEARAAALDVLAALDALEPAVHDAACWSMLTDSSLVLRNVAECIRQGDDELPVAENLARALYVGATLAWPCDGRELVRTLGDVGPWLEIRTALEQIVAAVGDLWGGSLR